LKNVLAVSVLKNRTEVYCSHNLQLTLMSWLMEKEEKANQLIAAAVTRYAIDTNRWFLMTSEQEFREQWEEAFASPERVKGNGEELKKIEEGICKM
jgi:hypothetical protein